MLQTVFVLIFVILENMVILWTDNVLVNALMIILHMIQPIGVYSNVLKDILVMLIKKNAGLLQYSVHMDMVIAILDYALIHAQDQNQSILMD